MIVHGSSVGVIGGSIAGCAAAIALTRLGADVTILERSSSGLKDRGSGIAVPIPLRDELVGAGYLPSGYRAWPATGRRWYVANGTESGDLRWQQPGAMVTNNWSELWKGLRSNVPDGVRYVDGARVTEIDDTGDGVTVHLADGSTQRFDVVVGADGYRSIVRSHLHPDSAPHFAGYVLWRGNFPSAQLSDSGAFDEVLASGEWLTVAFDGGHAVMYPIPDFDATTDDELRVNWAIYAPCPEALTIDGPSSIPPGAVNPESYAELRQLIAESIPARFQPLFAGSLDAVSIQPIYDELVDTYTKGRLALIGDAATLSRPHTGSGATKAMQDARLLESLGAEHDTWDTLLAAYDADRSATGRTLVELGRRIGRDQVEHTPPWTKMSPADYQAWASGTLSGESLYFWGDLDDRQPSTSST